MNRQVLFAQGAGPGTHDDWDEKLADSLRSALGASWTVLYPRLPQEADPDPAAWQVALRREFGKLRDGDVLVGHSFGGTMLLHAVAATPPPFRPSALVLLAAPFYGPGGWKSAALEVPPHLASRLPAQMPLRLYHGTRDETVPFAHLDLYAKAIPEASTTAIPEGDHQFHDDLMQVARDISSLLDPPRRQS